VAPPRRYPPPTEQLVLLLMEAREEGLSFEVAWARAMRPGLRLVMTNAEDPPAGAVLWPTDSRDREAWRKAIVGTKDAFRRAYLRRPPTRREMSASQLASLLLPDGAGERQGALAA